MHSDSSCFHSYRVYLIKSLAKTVLIIPPIAGSYDVYLSSAKLGINCMFWHHHQHLITWHRQVRFTTYITGVGCKFWRKNPLCSPVSGELAVRWHFPMQQANLTGCKSTNAYTSPIGAILSIAVTNFSSICKCMHLGYIQL